MDITNGLTLSSAVKDKSTPLSQYLRGKFPNTRQLQQEYKTITGELIVDSQGAPAGTVGTAMDLLVRFLLDPNDVPESSRARFPASPKFLTVVDELIHTATHRAAAGGSTQQHRAIWALALCVEAYRAGSSFLSIVDELVHRDAFDVETMLAQASNGALAELVALRTTAEQHLIPRLDRPFYLGPEFDDSKRGKSQRIAAEADLICNGLLLDIKTQLGGKNAAGTRTDTMSGHQIYQLLAYALLDHSDSYSINRLGIYSARYGALVAWPLDYVSSTMAGAPVDFPAERQAVRDMLYA